MEDFRDEDGHAQARELKVREEHEEAYEREHQDMKDEIGNGAKNTGDENYSSEHEKKE